MQEAAENPQGQQAQANLKQPVVSTEKPLTHFTVVKRNGMLVPFRKDRVASAVEAAFRAHHSIPATVPLSQELHLIVQRVTDLVVEEVRVQGSDSACITVEGIQDIVEIKLMQAGQYDVARRYIQDFQTSSVVAHLH